MERFYTKIVGTPIFEDDGLRPVTTIKDVVVDPETGKLVGLVVNSSKNLVITPLDILSWQDGMYISGRDAIIHGSEVLRLKKIQESGIRIFNNRVETQSGKYLGKVVDFSVDNNLFTIKKLYVSKGFLGLIRYDSKIIPYRNIIEILADKIIVKEDLMAIKVKNERDEMVIEDMPVG